MITKCLICSVPVPTNSSYEDVCSGDCAKKKLDYNNITIPLPFLKNILIKTKSETERMKKIIEFCNRHKYDLALCEKKIDRLARSMLTVERSRG